MSDASACATPNWCFFCFEILTFFFFCFSLQWFLLLRRFPLAISTRLDINCSFSLHLISYADSMKLALQLECRERIRKTKICEKRKKDASAMLHLPWAVSTYTADRQTDKQISGAFRYSQVHIKWTDATMGTHEPAALCGALCTHSTSNKCIITVDAFRCSFAGIETSHSIWIQLFQTFGFWMNSSTARAFWWNLLGFRAVFPAARPNSFEFVEQIFPSSPPLQFVSPLIRCIAENCN